MNVKEVADNVSGGELCQITVASCAMYTAAALANWVPGDAILLGFTCASIELGCVLYNAFKDEHGDVKADVFRAQEDAGDIDEVDYIMVPSSWNWHA